MDEMRPLWRTYSAVGGHVCGTHPAEDYVRPTTIKQEQEGVCSDLSLLVDETTDCTDDHPINIILGTRCRICYITTAFIARNEAVNGATIGDAVIAAWENLNLLRHAVKLVLVDNAGYCAKSFREHLAAFFKNARLSTCWGPPGNQFAAPLQEHPNMTPLCTYMKYMRRNLVHFQTARVHRLLWAKNCLIILIRGGLLHVMLLNVMPHFWWLSSSGCMLRQPARKKRK